MTAKFRKLNQDGISEFAGYVRGGATGPAPLHLLDNPGTSQPLTRMIEPGTAQFGDRYMFGCYLRSLLKEYAAAEINSDTGLWSALALKWFDRLCPIDARGNRNPKEEYYYVLSSDYKHYYRHLVRSPWQLVKDHREAAQFLLISPQKRAHPLSIHGEILEQFGGRQQVLRSKPIIRAANKLYFNQQEGRPKRGVAGRGRGSARRFGLVLRQFDLTYDPEWMSDDAIIDILPNEFDRWRRPAASARPKAA